MELYRKVRQAYFRQGMSKRGISRHFGISRDSVDKMVLPGWHYCHHRSDARTKAN